MRTVALSVVIGLVPSLATGFAIHDLTKLPFEPATALGTGYLARTDSARLSMVCTGCTGYPMLDVLLGRQDDGTEGRVRSGVTTIAQLDATCKSRMASCRIDSVAVAPAVGWMSSYRLGAQFAHTIVVIRDGDLLTIRSLAGDSTVARHNADVLLTTVVPAIVGK